MMTLFSLIADQVHDKQELFDNEVKIMQVLLRNGYILQEADAALTLMQTLVQKQSEELFTPKRSSISMRAMNREERGRFSVDAFGFVTKLTSLGMITEDQREDLLERAMTVYAERIGLDHIKSLVALTLFANSREQDVHAPSTGRRIKNSSWN